MPQQGKASDDKRVLHRILAHSLGNPYVHFLEQIKALDEADYGDFMRKANSYLLDLAENEITLSHPALRNKILDIQDYLQFNPNWDIETTRRRVLRDTDELIYLDSTGGN